MSDIVYLGRKVRDGCQALLSCCYEEIIVPHSYATKSAPQMILP